MSAPASTWADTPEGLVCTAIHALMVVDYPGLVLGIGPDGDSLHKAPPSAIYTFGDEPIARGQRNNAPFRREIPVTVTLWMRDPVEAINAWTSFLVALNRVAHGRAGTPQRATKKGGAIGSAGCEVIGLFTLRLAVIPPALRVIAPLTTKIIAAAAPAVGATVEVVPLGP